MSQFVCVFGLKPVYSSSSIKLSSKNFISLDETIELACQVCILALQAVRVLFEGVSLRKQISVVCAALHRGHPQRLYLSAHAKQGAFFFLEASLSVTHLDCHIRVSALLEINFFSQVVVFSCNSLIVSSQSGIFS